VGADEHAAVAVRLLQELDRQLEILETGIGGEVPVGGVRPTLTDQLAVLHVPPLRAVDCPAGEIGAVEERDAFLCGRVRGRGDKRDHRRCERASDSAGEFANGVHVG
jgi:hypothetical protein